MRALWLPAVLRSAGLVVHEVSGWKTRGYEPFDPYGVIIHATAGKLSVETDLRVILNGSTTAPPPISQLFLARSGEWWVVASGRCNHALTGTAGNMAGYGNSKLLGIEAANDNRGEPWPSVQYESYVRGVAAICAYQDDAASKRRWTTARVSGHKEHQPNQKSDPTFNMDAFRSSVTARMTVKPTPQETDMQPVLIQYPTGPVLLVSMGQGHLVMDTAEELQSQQQWMRDNGMNDRVWPWPDKYRPLAGPNLEEKQASVFADLPALADLVVERLEAKGLVTAAKLADAKRAEADVLGS